MANTQLNIRFDGRVKARVLLSAMSGLLEVVEGLSREYLELTALDRTEDETIEVEWSLGEDLGASFTSALVGRASSSALLEFVERETIAVQESVRVGETTSHSDRVEAGAKRFLNSVNGYIKEATLATPAGEVRIDQKVQFPKRPKTQFSDFGTVYGSTKAISIDRANRFSLVVEDQGYGVNVRCSLTPEQLEVAKLALPGRIELSGMLVASAITGAPVRMKQVEEIEILPPVDNSVLSRLVGSWNVPAGYVSIPFELGDELDLVEIDE